jgi:hypothetical protein
MLFVYDLIYTEIDISIYIDYRYCKKKYCYLFWVMRLVEWLDWLRTTCVVAAVIVMKSGWLRGVIFGPSEIRVPVDRGLNDLYVNRSLHSVP